MLTRLSGTALADGLLQTADVIVAIGARFRTEHQPEIRKRFLKSILLLARYPAAALLPALAAVLSKAPSHTCTPVTQMGWRCALVPSSPESSVRLCVRSISSRSFARWMPSQAQTRLQETRLQ